MDSLIPQLTSLATTTMAIGLAYVRLDRFHYRDRIRDRARAALNRFNDDPRILKRLQGLHTIAVLQHLADDSNTGVSRDSNPATSLPWSYRKLVAPGVDRHVCWIGVYLSLVVVLIGSFQGLGVGYVTTALNSRTIAIIVTSVLAMLLVFEIILVRLGDWIQAKMYDVINSKSSELAKEVSICIDTLEFSNQRTDDEENRGDNFLKILRSTILDED